MPRTPPIIESNTHTVAGRKTVIPQGTVVIKLRGDVRANAIRYSLMKEANSSSAFQVPALKQLRVIDLRAKDNNFSTGMLSTFAHSTAVPTQDSVGAPVGIVYLDGSGISPTHRGFNSAAAGGDEYATSEDWIIPAGSYPVYKGFGGANHTGTLVGILEDI